jgi:hypothetical protein
MAGIMAFRVVGVDRVGVVGGHAARGGDDPVDVVDGVDPRTGEHALDDVGEQRPRGAARRRRTDLLVVEQRRHEHAWAGLGVEQRRDRRPARHLVVQPPAGEQRTVGAEHARRLEVVEAQLPEGRLDTGTLAEPRGESVAQRRVTRRPNRAQVHVTVEDDAAVVELAGEVDSQSVAVPSAATTRPATPRSRSSQLLSSGPP